MQKTALGFTLIELLVVIVIIGVVTFVVSLQIHPFGILGKSRDDVRKVDINQIANAYETQAVGRNFYEPLVAQNIGSGKIPNPPEGGQYQGLLTEPQDYYFVCASLEKGKDINCLVNSENVNCYCRKSKDAPTPAVTATPAPSFSPNPSPSGIGTPTPEPSPTLTPSPSQTLTPAPSPTPSPIPTPDPSQPPVIGGSCISQIKPAAITLEGLDGSWCYDSDGNANHSGAGYCIDDCSNTTDFCEGGESMPVARDGYCSGIWTGFWTNVHCEFGGYECFDSLGKYCSADRCSLSTPPAVALPLASNIDAKRVFITSTKYNGNLGGLSGADSKCQSRAEAANLGGTWKAWISDDNSSVDTRFNHFNSPYKRIDGIVIAGSWTDLTNGNLLNPIIIDEYGASQKHTSSGVWTGTNYDGSKVTNNCLNWTNSFWFFQGQIGGIATTTSYWTKSATGDSVCSSSAWNLYCFEQ